MHPDVSDQDSPVTRDMTRRDFLESAGSTQPGFNNDTAPRYDGAAAKLAWERTIAFFNAHVRDAG